MSLRFRSFLPFIIPGTIAFVSWWLYTSFKKNEDTGLDEQEEADKGCLSISDPQGLTGQDRPEAIEQRPAEQDVVLQVHAPAAKSSVGEPLSSPVVMVASGKLVTPFHSKAATDSLLNGPENARLVTQVLSAAAQEVMAVSSCVVSEVASSSTPTFNGEETMREEDHESPLPSLQSQANHLEQRVAQITEEVVNGCLTPSAWEKSEDEQQCTLAAQAQLELTPVLPELQAEEAPTGTDDSGCGTRPSEDDISSGDLLLSTDLSLAIPENKEDLIQISGISRASEEKEDGLQDSSDLTRLQEPMLTAEHMAAVCHAGTTSSMNGSSETEANQSGGSAVNSVDSGDSCSTLGTGDGQQSGNQTCQSQRSELIVWEIEVPEHLVGQLTGRKGRHVSFLKKSSGAKIYISTLPYAEEFKICHIEGTQQQVDKALALIGKKFKDLDLTNLYAPPPQQPKPEGGVVDDVLTVPFAENVQEDSVKDCLSTTDDLPPTTLTSVDQCAQAVSQLSFVAESLKRSVSFPLSASTPVPDASTEAQHHENEDLGEPAKTSDSMEELHRLPARLVTQVLSAAAQEVMAVSSCVVSAVASSSTPTFNGEETMREEDHESPLPPLQSQANHLEQRVAQITEEVVNGCLTPSAWEKSEDEQQCTLAAQTQLELTPALPELQAEEAATGTDDSGCGTHLSEDDISSGDLPLSTDLSLAIPENKEDLIQISGISRASEEKEDGLQESSDLTRLQETMLTAQHMAALCHAGTTSSMNGSSETEADQSGGSAVNSVDSGDSCSTLGTGNGQQSGNQTSQSQRSELIVWEIEVPEHLVGILTGRKGRHVSFLKKSSGAKIYISTLPYAEEFKICHIEGTQQQVDKALALIGKKFKDLDMTNLYAPPPQRPKPEGGVVDDVLTVPFAENVQEDSVTDSLSTKDDLPPTTLTSVDQCAQAVSQLSFIAESLKGSVSFPLSASTPVPDASTEAQHHENGDLGEPAKTSDSMEELHRLPARLVTQVISAAAQEVMAVSSCVVSAVASSSTPTFNGEETMREEDHESPLPPLQSQANHLEQRVAQITEEVVNGCLTPSAWEKSEDEQQCTLAAQAQLELTPVLPELQAGEATTGTDDSGCGTRLSEDDISSGDLLLSTDLSLAIPENKEDLIQISGISRASEEKEDGLQDSSDLTRLQEPMLTAQYMAALCHAGTTSSMNGSNETEADQSGGSAVNSVDSGDSCSTLGTGDGQQSGNQTSQSQRSELIVWEIEVPEHLVGQLTGRKGRHVSFLKKSSGAKIYISTLPYAEEFKICHIEGTQQQVDKALALIGKKFKDLDLTNLYAPPPQRPKPEGGVVDDVLTVPFAENVQEDSVKDSLSTTDDLPPTTLTSVDQCAQAVSQLSFVAESLKGSVSFPLSASTPVPDASTEAQHHENEDLGEPAKSSDSMEELHRLPARLVTQVLSAAAQEVMAVSSCVVSAVASSSTPTFNGEETMREEDHESPLPPLQSQANHLEQRVAQITEEVVNGCLTPSVREKSEDEQQCTLAAQTQLELTPALPELQAEEAATGTDDSGCGTRLSEDDISSGDLLLSTDLSLAIPENKEDLIQISGISRASEEKEDGLQESSDLTRLQEPMLTAQYMAALCHAGTTSSMNGSSETEADQSGGSAVNSVDSGDSCSTLGTGNGQRSGNQTSQSQRSELIVWEIEVPNHLVGRLIGQQGRHVSFLKKSSGAKIYISTLPYTDESEICHIEGTQQQVDKALALIGKKFKDLDLTNLYAPPLPLSLPRSLPMLPWLLLPYGVTVEVIGVNIVSAGHMFVQQHTHPTFHALRSLDQQMFLCYSQSDTPALPSPAEVGVICAAPAVGGAWWRAQVISFYKDSNEVEIQYVDYGGYNRVKIDTLRQIRSDFVTLPFQGTEVLLDNIAPLPGEDWFSTEATHALEEMTLGVPLLAQVTNYDKYTGLPVVQMWNMVGDDDFIRKKNLILGHFRPSSAFSRVLIGLPSDFVTLPFQGTEVLLDNIAPLPGEDRFSTEATHALEEMTQGVPLLTQVTNYDNDTGLLLVEMWNFLGDDVLEHPLILLDQDGRGRVSPLDLTRLVVVGRKEGNIKTSAQQLKEKSL